MPEMGQQRALANGWRDRGASEIGAPTCACTARCCILDEIALRRAWARAETIGPRRDALGYRPESECASVRGYARYSRAHQPFASSVQRSRVGSSAFGCFGQRSSGERWLHAAKCAMARSPFTFGVLGRCMTLLPLSHRIQRQRCATTQVVVSTTNRITCQRSACVLRREASGPCSPDLASMRFHPAALHRGSIALAFLIPSCYVARDGHASPCAPAVPFVAAHRLC